MTDLIAQGPMPEDRWRRPLPVDRPVVLGREADTWSAPWDSRISRHHIELRWDRQSLHVRRLEGARNSVFVRGRKEDDFQIEPGEHFVIGDTTFTLADERVDVAVGLPRPVAERTFTAQYFRDVRYRDADQRIDVLSRVPEMIAGAANDQEMFVRLISMLMTGVKNAVAAAIVTVEPGESDPSIEVLHWDRRILSDRGFRPSQHLIRRAMRLQESVMHVWSDASPASEQATLTVDADWAYCTPVSGSACRGWAIYVTGRFPAEFARSDESTHELLRDDLKFTELVASTLGNVREARLLERRQSSLRQFFSPVVLEALAGRDPDVVLAPREADVSVLFCDLRGFTRQSERGADDLRGLLNRVSNALGVTTGQIFEHGGVVGDFHGDAVMGFWGWPLPQEDAAVRAGRAALAIRTEFLAAASQAGNALSDFRIGLGIASGRAVAGKIGTVDQVKVTAFGPVVNIASRLEGMTKILNGSILVDGPTADLLRSDLPADEGRLRRVAVVQPYGFDSAVQVDELLPPANERPDLCEQHIQAYEQSLDAFLDGDWQQAFHLLHRVPADDRVKDFLTVYIAQHHRVAPADWDGVIRMDSK